MAIIEIQDLCYTYPGAAQPTLDHLDLTVEPGDFLAIVGNNGCGKSTLCKVLNGLIPHFITGSFTGTVKVAGQDTLQSDVGDLARKVGYVYQDFENQIVRPTVLDDASYADRIYGVLRELNEKWGKTILVIEHHTEYIADYCKHVLLLKEGRVRWMLPTRQALARVEELRQSNIFPPQVTQAGYALQQRGLLAPAQELPTTVAEGKAAFAPLARTPIARENPPRPQPGPEAAALHGVTVAYRSVKGEPRVVFDGLELTFRKGEKIALIGSNGAGKSTLMKLLVGLLKPNKGSVSLEGTLLRDTKPEDLSRRISLVYQNPEEMFIKDSIRADIAYAMQVRGVDQWQQKTDVLLERFRLTELADRDGRLLSGGQMRRASLAIGVALNPGILLLDEPTANLDIATRREILRTLNDMKAITETVLIATHDMQLVCEWAQRIIVLCGGKVVADGTRDEIFGDAALAARVGIRPPEIFTMGRALDEQALCYTVPEFLCQFEGENGV